jgi:hypothetical protein
MNPYNELKELPALSGSLNSIVSEQYRMRRPPSLSESCAWTELNLERRSTHFIIKENPSESQGIEHRETKIPTTQSYECFFVINGLRFLFHITLISVFETVFFFLYISTLEDSGITKTIDYFINSAVDSCKNFTQEEIVISNTILQSLFNTTQIALQANSAYMYRLSFNHVLFKQSWVYVGVLGCSFLILTAYSRIRSIPVQWLPLILENLGLVFLLAAYEYMFFSTIIFPFKPLSAEEISESALQKLNTTCGLL